MNMNEEQTEVLEPEVQEEKEIIPSPEVQEPETQEPVQEPEDHKSGFERRAKKLSDKAREAEERAQFWYNEAQKVQGRTQTQAPAQDEKEPVFEDYNDINAFGRAIGAYQAKIAVREALAERDSKRSSSSVLNSYNTKLQEFRKQTPDFDEVFEDLDVPMPEDLMHGILESESGPQIAYHLAKNPDEVKRLNKLSPYKRLVELGKIEAKMVKIDEKPAPVKKVTSAPGNIKTPNSTVTAPKNEDSMSAQEWINYRNEQDRKRGRR